MANARRIIRQAQEQLPDLKELEDRLKSDPSATTPPRVKEEAAIQKASGLESALESALGAEALVPEQPEDEETRRVLDEGIRAVEKVAREGADAQLTPPEQTGLEAIVLLYGRPALFVQQGRFAEPPPEWAVLNQHRQAIESALRSVGRIELEGGGMVGTGFLVGEDVIMTNRHVASVFSRRALDGNWRFKVGMTPVIDYAEEKESVSSAEFPLVSVIGIHQDPDVDLALLRVAPDPGSELPEGWTKGTPLSLATKPPLGTGDARDVYLVGYPATDNQGISAPDALLRIFSNVFEVKRLQPGKLTEIAEDRPIFTHDCSTLGGNSGSCVIDLETHQVIGLHYRGAYLEDNFAVALWKLAADPIVKKAGIHFV